MKINGKYVSDLISIQKEKPKCNGVPYLVLIYSKHIDRSYCSIGTFYGGAKPEWDFSWSFNKDGENFDENCKVTHWGYLPNHKNISL